VADEHDDARRALERAARESDTFAASSLRRMSDHFGGRDAVGAGGETDAIELWGRRIGRALSLVGVVALSLWLLVQLQIL
jgi:ferric-dicitrate binding protein FerR (iron transport regulator)